MDRVYNIYALRELSPGRSEVVALWGDAGWTTDPTRVKNYWSHSDAIAALGLLQAEGLHRGFDAVDIFDFEYQEPSDRKRWNPGRSLQGPTWPQAVALLNEVRSAIASLDYDDRNPAIKAALTVGWKDTENIETGRKAKKRWGEARNVLPPEEVQEILDAMGDALAQGDPDDKSDIVTVALKILDRASETLKEDPHSLEFEALTKLAIDDFRAEYGREPKLGWWDDPLSTEFPE